MTFLLELREAAKSCPDMLFRKLLKDAADDIANAIVALGLDPTVERMRALNGAWAKAVRVLDRAPGPPSDAGTSAGLRDGALLRMAA